MASNATRVFMVRHGATVLSAEDRFAGATDVAISDEGREQTRRLAERLRHEKNMAIYASPLGRTVETASILAAPHKLEVQTRDGFREINHGRWEQMTRREFPGKNILVVSHKATIRLLLSSLLGFDPRRYRDNLDQRPAALNIVDFRDATRPRLTLFNDTSHYDKAGKAIPEIPASRLSKWWNERVGA